MKTYNIFFEIYGKKMKVQINALSPERAEIILRSKIEIHKIEEELPKNDFEDFFNKLFK